MDRTSVSSSNLRSVGYNQDDQILEIEFNSGESTVISVFPQIFTQT